MNIDLLKKISSAESKLKRQGMEEKKKELMEFADDPEIARLIAYMDTYQEDVSEDHPVYKYLEQLKSGKNGKEIVRQIVNERVQKRKENDKKKDEERDKIDKENKKKKQEEIVNQVNLMLTNLEKETDKIFDYLTRNQKDLTADLGNISKVLNTRKFLISIKNGFKIAKMK